MRVVGAAVAILASLLVVTGSSEQTGNPVVFEDGKTVVDSRSRAARDLIPSNKKERQISSLRRIWATVGVLASSLAVVFLVSGCSTWMGLGSSISRGADARLLADGGLSQCEYVQFQPEASNPASVHPLLDVLTLDSSDSTNLSAEQRSSIYSARFVVTRMLRELFEAKVRVSELSEEIQSQAEAGATEGKEAQLKEMSANARYADALLKLERLQKRLDALRVTPGQMRDELLIRASSRESSTPISVRAAAAVVTSRRVLNPESDPQATIDLEQLKSIHSLVYSIHEEGDSLIWLLRSGAPHPSLEQRAEAFVVEAQATAHQLTTLNMARTVAHALNIQVNRVRRELVGLKQSKSTDQQASSNRPASSRPRTPSRQGADSKAEKVQSRASFQGGIMSSSPQSSSQEDRSFTRDASSNLSRSVHQRRDLLASGSAASLPASQASPSGQRSSASLSDSASVSASPIVARIDVLPDTEGRPATSQSGGSLSLDRYGSRAPQLGRSSSFYSRTASPVPVPTRSRTPQPGLFSSSYNLDALPGPSLMRSRTPQPGLSSSFYSRSASPGPSLMRSRTPQPGLFSSSYNLDASPGPSLMRSRTPQPGLSSYYYSRGASPAPALETAGASRLTQGASTTGQSQQLLTRSLTPQPRPPRSESPWSSLQFQTGGFPSPGLSSRHPQVSVARSQSLPRGTRTTSSLPRMGGSSAAAFPQRGTDQEESFYGHSHYISSSQSPRGGVSGSSWTEAGGLSARDSLVLQRQSMTPQAPTTQQGNYSPPKPPRGGSSGSRSAVHGQRPVSSPQVPPAQMPQPPIDRSGAQSEHFEPESQQQP